MKCIYVAIGQKASTVAQVYELFVDPRRDGVHYDRVRAHRRPHRSNRMAPFAGWRDGRVLLYNEPARSRDLHDLSKHADAYRHAVAAAAPPPGREAVPGWSSTSTRRLLERACKLSTPTAGFAHRAPADRRDAGGRRRRVYPTNVISITTGRFTSSPTSSFSGGGRRSTSVSPSRASAARRRRRR